MPDDFHFIHPLWLLALIPLALLAWRACRAGGDNAWERVVDARLLALLVVGPAQKANRAVLWLLALGWLVATLALADPAWQRKPQPVVQTSAARVVVLDLSSSMSATDPKPSRIARARYKVEDVLALGSEGQTGLVVYAGDAYVVTPLTRDVNTIRSQLAALAPDLMPSDGSRADLGLLKAEGLLRRAGLSTGQVLLIADGVEADALTATERAAARLLADGFRVSVLDVGAAQGAPAADVSALRSVAQAGGGGHLSINDGLDSLRAWLDVGGASQAAGLQRSNAVAQGWQDEGPWLVLLLLPLAALAFRRHWLLSVMLLPLLAMHPRDATASTWNDLWQRPDQQAAAALRAGDYARAAKLATDAERRGSAEYKRGNYQQALDSFSHAAGPQADYNRGNAEARLGRYADAVASYDKALKADPGNEDARANKAAVEALLKQQQQRDQQQARQQQQSPSQKSADQKSADQKAQQQAGAGSSSEAKQGSGRAMPRARRRARGRPARPVRLRGRAIRTRRNRPDRRLRRRRQRQKTARRTTLGPAHRETPQPAAAASRRARRMRRPHRRRSPATSSPTRREGWRRRTPRRRRQTHRRACSRGHRRRAGAVGSEGSAACHGCVVEPCAAAAERRAIGGRAMAAAHSRRPGRFASPQVPLPIPSAGAAGAWR